MNFDIEKVKETMRGKLGADADLDYITADLLAEAMQNAHDANAEQPVGGQPGTSYTIYGNNISDSGGVVYWAADSSEAGPDGGCGSSWFQSRNIVNYGFDSYCPNGKSRYWMEKKYF